MESRIPRYKIEGPLVTGALHTLVGRIVASEGESYLRTQRWFRSKGRTIASLSLRDCGVVKEGAPCFILALVHASYEDATPETYYLPLAVRPERSTTGDSAIPSSAIIARLDSASGSDVVFDALTDQEFCEEILQLIQQGWRVTTNGGRFEFSQTPVLGELGDRLSASTIGTVKRIATEQTNSSVIVPVAGRDALILKNFRKVEDGLNPDLEVSYFLTTKTRFKHAPPLAGYVTYAGEDGFGGSIASLQAFIKNRGDGWSYTLGHLRSYYELAARDGCQFRWADSARPPFPEDAAGHDRRLQDWTRMHAASYLNDVIKLAQVTGQLHLALASETSDPDFRPESITSIDVSRWIGAMRDLLADVFETVGQQVKRQAVPGHTGLSWFLEHRGLLEGAMDDLHRLLDGHAQKTRCHGDYHLGQVLKTDDDFVVLDFEGEPARPLGERRAKHSPLKDIAGMFRSFNYAAYGALLEAMASHPDQMQTLEPWAAAWEHVMCSTFLDTYLAGLRDGGATFLPASRESVERVISVYELEKAIYEVGYEVNNRPAWLGIPLKGLQATVQRR